VTTYRISEHALSAALEDGTVLLHLHTKRYYSLNETGAAVWRMLEDGSTREAIIQRLVAEFDVDTERAAAEVDRLLDELAAEQLISRHEG
jgi:hypothetical protein